MCTYTLKLQDNKLYLPISEECDPSLYTRSRCCFEWKQKGGSRQGLSQMDWHVHCLKGAQRKKEIGVSNTIRRWQKKKTLLYVIHFVGV